MVLLFSKSIYNPNNSTEKKTHHIEGDELLQMRDIKNVYLNATFLVLEFKKLVVLCRTVLVSYCMNEWKLHCHYAQTVFW